MTVFVCGPHTERAPNDVDRSLLVRSFDRLHAYFTQAHTRHVRVVGR